MSNEATRPNILFLFSDQQRADTVSAYGQITGAPLNLTPELDKLAARGTLFERQMTCQPVCGPARAVLQTGRYASQIPVQINDVRLPDNVPTIANYLNDAGYETSYVGKWHLASQKTGKPEAKDHQDYRVKPIPEAYRGGYKDWWIASDVLEFTSHGYGGEMFNAEMQSRSFEHYRADATTDFALEYLADRKLRQSEDPFFLFVSYIEPHHQNDRNRYEGPEGSKERFAEYEAPLDLVKAKELGIEGDWEKEFPDYLGQIASIDENIARYIQALEDAGELDNTVIFYTSDHGSHFKTRNSEYKRSCHDASIHVPLIIAGPGFDTGRRVESVTSLVDLPATILEAAGIEVPEDMQGFPLQALVKDPKVDQSEEKLTAHPRRAAYVEITEHGLGRAIRTDRYTYCVQLDVPEDRMRQEVYAMFAGDWDENLAFQASPTNYFEMELYDNEQDPEQWNNLIADPSYKSIKAELRDTFIQLAKLNEGVEVTVRGGC